MTACRAVTLPHRTPCPEPSAGVFTLGCSHEHVEQGVALCQWHHDNLATEAICPVCYAHPTDPHECPVHAAAVR